MYFVLTKPSPISLKNTNEEEEMGRNYLSSLKDSIKVDKTSNSSGQEEKTVDIQRFLSSPPAQGIFAFRTITGHNKNKQAMNANIYSWPTQL